MAIIWVFKTRNFEIVCAEEEADFLDPLIHDQMVIDAAEGIEIPSTSLFPDDPNCTMRYGGFHHVQALITHLRAYVLIRGVEIASVSLRDCVYSDLCPERDVIVTHSGYRNEVVRKAIRMARMESDELKEAFPDLYLRSNA